MTSNAHNFIKFHAWANSHVNFPYPVTGPLRIRHAVENACVHTICKLEPSPCFPICQFMTSSRHILSDVILTHPQSYSVNQGQVDQ